jgi:hypothetical protein
MHGAPHYTPHQIIEAGQRAEADGQIQYALQFYRHVLENYAASGEAAFARERLLHLEAVAHPAVDTNVASMHPSYPAVHMVTQARGPAMSAVPGPHGPIPHGADAAMAMPAIARQREGQAKGQHVQSHGGTRAHPVAGPRDAYRLGRFVARLLTVLGWLSFILGGAAAGLAAVVSAGVVPARAIGGIAVLLPFGGSAAVSGFVMIFFGQFARASFDTANATRELVAIARSKSGAGAQNGQRQY